MNEKRLFIVEFDISFPDGAQTRTERVKIPVVETDADAAFTRAQGMARQIDRLEGFHTEYNSTYQLVR